MNSMLKAFNSHCLTMCAPWHRYGVTWSQVDNIICYISDYLCLHWSYMCVMGQQISCQYSWIHLDTAPALHLPFLISGGESWSHVMTMALVRPRTIIFITQHITSIHTNMVVHPAHILQENLQNLRIDMPAKDDFDNFPEFSSRMSLDSLGGIINIVVNQTWWWQASSCAD